MQLTRKLFDSMKEATLQNDVLIPLFRSMGFHDVKRNDGGPNELGKDLVMWREEGLRERVNYAVVIKAEKITGQASGLNNSASTVLFQVTQAFNESYPDPSTAEEQTIQHCLVVSSKEISKEAINAIKGTLRKTNLDKITTFIDGDALWHLIETYLPEKGVLAEMQSAKKRLETLLEDTGLAEQFFIVANTEGEFLLKPKDPDALKKHPMHFPVQVKFDTNDPDGATAFDEFKRFLSTGAPLKLTDPYVSRPEMPEFMERLFGFTPQRIEVSISHVPQIKHPCRLKMVCDDGEIAQVDYLVLEDVQRGKDEVTLSNEAQESAWKLKVVMDNDKVSFSLNFSPIGLNVFEAAQGFRFQSVMSKGGKLTIESLSTGFDFASQSVTPGKYPPPDSKWMELVEALLFIQQRTNCLLKYPESVSHEDAQNVFAVRQILQSGRIQVLAEPWETKPLTREQAEYMLRNLGDGQPRELVVHYEPNSTIDLFQTTVPLGPVVYSCKEAYMTAEDLASLRRFVEATESEDTFTARITPTEGQLFDAVYVHWLQIDEKDAVLRSPMFRVGTLQNAARILWDATSNNTDHFSAFVEALSEVRSFIADEHSAPESQLNPFSDATDDEMQLALQPIFRELDGETRRRLVEIIRQTNLMSEAAISNLNKLPIDGM